MRPLLLPGLVVAWRAPDQLQVAGPTTRGQEDVVLCGVSPAVERVFALLDGTRLIEEVMSEAARAGAPAAEVGQVLHALLRAGLVTHNPVAGAADAREGLSRWWTEMRALAGQADSPDQALSKRRRSGVALYGLRSVGPVAAAVMASAGVGRVVLADRGRVSAEDCLPGGLTPADVGRSRTAAAASAARRAEPGVGVRTTTGRGGISCALFGDGHGGRAGVLRHLREARIPHLHCRVIGATGTVGPFVLPGASPCLGCIRRHRTDLDPAWPLLEAQAESVHNGTGPGAAASLSVTVAGLAAGQVLSLLDGQTPDTVGAVWEVRAGTLRTRRQLWSRHPDCSCSSLDVAGSEDPSSW